MKRLGTVLALLSVLIAAPLAAQQQQGPMIIIPGQQEIPLHVKLCRARTQIIGAMVTYRTAGATTQEVTVIIDVAEKVMKSMTEMLRQRDPEYASPDPKVIDWQRTKMEEIYSIPQDDFENPAFMRLYEKKSFEQCLSDHAPKEGEEPPPDRAPAEQQRMLPRA